ncbi:MAG: LacI family DNA-binding transcriptional regulator [Anaerolineales bacterium]|nr:LacI family DNA-binding transcriptional regulator [Anaerolineales bacterium]
MPSKRRITSHEVAKRAGVSRTTVSFVLNEVERAQISEETRQRVLQAARDLAYVPDAAARSLASGRTHILGLIICQPANHLMIDAYIHQVIYGLSKAGHERGFRVLLESVEDVSQPDAYTHLVRSNRIDGILLSGPRSDDMQLSALIADGFPTVLLGRLSGAPVCFVDVDNQAAAQQAVTHLVKLGHQRIACITNGPLPYTSAADRLLGYRQALLQARLDEEEDLIQYGDFDMESGYRAMQTLLAVKLRPTAVFVASDVVAFGAMAAIRDSHLSIPEDMAIVGFDDVPMARFVAPALTTIRLSAVEQGRRGGEMLIDLIEGKKLVEQQAFLSAELIVRQSCGAGLLRQGKAQN